MAQHKVSVVMNTYHDDPSMLERAIKSYVNQQGVETQLIVSTVFEDREAQKLARKWKAHVSVIQKPGIYQQLNKALPMVEGDWFTYASGNDFALPHKLHHEVQCCLANKAKVCYSNFYYAGTDGVITNKTKFREYDYEAHLLGNYVSDLGLCHISILNKYGPFKSEWGNGAYWDFWLRVAEGEGPDVFTLNKKPEWIYCVSKASRHMKRKKDRGWIKRNANIKKRMIAWHRGLAE